MTVKHWNTGTAAMRFRLKNKKRKKLQAASAKLQAPSNKPRPALIQTQLKYINNLESEK
jgi:hypothetical protein